MATDWAKLRRIMYEPSAVWLSTDNSGARWLTDQFVLYEVTGREYLRCYGESYPVEWEDGSYQLTVTAGFKQRASVPEPDIEAYFEKQFEKAWYYAEPTEWSVAEHPGKAQLWTIPGLDIPCLLGESTWTELKRYHPDVTMEYATVGNIFRFSEVRHQGCDEDAECDCRPVIFCYAAGIRIPDGQQDIANEIARAA